MSGIIGGVGAWGNPKPRESEAEGCIRFRQAAVCAAASGAALTFGGESVSLEERCLELGVRTIWRAAKAASEAAAKAAAISAVRTTVAVAASAVTVAAGIGAAASAGAGATAAAAAAIAEKTAWVALTAGFEAACPIILTLFMIPLVVAGTVVFAVETVREYKDYRFHLDLENRIDADRQVAEDQSRSVGERRAAANSCEAEGRELAEHMQAHHQPEDPFFCVDTVPAIFKA